MREGVHALRLLFNHCYHIPQAQPVKCTFGPSKSPDNEDTRLVERLLREGMDKCTNQQESEMLDLAKDKEGHFFKFIKCAQS